MVVFVATSSPYHLLLLLEIPQDLRLLVIFNELNRDPIFPQFHFVRTRLWLSLDVDVECFLLLSFLYSRGALSTRILEFSHSGFCLIDPTRLRDSLTSTEILQSYCWLSLHSLVLYIIMIICHNPVREPFHKKILCSAKM